MHRGAGAPGPLPRLRPSDRSQRTFSSQRRTAIFMRCAAGWSRSGVRSRRTREHVPGCPRLDGVNALCRGNV